MRASGTRKMKNTICKQRATFCGQKLVLCKHSPSIVARSGLFACIVASLACFAATHRTPRREDHSRMDITFRSFVHQIVGLPPNAERTPPYHVTQHQRNEGLNDFDSWAHSRSRGRIMFLFEGIFKVCRILRRQRRWVRCALALLRRPGRPAFLRRPGRPFSTALGRFPKKLPPQERFGKRPVVACKHQWHAPDIFFAQFSGFIFNSCLVPSFLCVRARRHRRPREVTIRAQPPFSYFFVLTPLFIFRARHSAPIFFDIHSFFCFSWPVELKSVGLRLAQAYRERRPGANRRIGSPVSV
jgi:hypothetical protein